MHMNYREPDQSLFTQTLKTISDTLQGTYDNLLTKAGSVVYELIMRPFAYLLAWFNSNITEYMSKYSVSYLMTSSATDTEYADIIASNYFTSRRIGDKARGMVTALLSKPLLQLPRNTLFDIGGIGFITEKSIIATGSAPEVAGDVQYIPVMPAGKDTYMAFIPVVARNAGEREFFAGTPVKCSYNAPQVLAFKLTTPITGGQSAETDSELMTRLKLSVSNPVTGTRQSLKRRLIDAAMGVQDTAVISGEDSLIQRGRLNNLNLNLGGVIDCYVKTSKQAAAAYKHVTWSAETPSTEHVISIDDTAYKGLYTVSVVSFNSAAPNHSCEIRYGDDIDALSNRQQVSVKIVTSTPVSSYDAVLLISYMPYIESLQLFMDTDNNRYIGQDIRIKAAVPINVRLDCALESLTTVTDDQLNALKNVLSGRVNALPIGCGILNFSDLQKAVESTYPQMRLRLPCAMTASVMLRDRNQGAFYSSTGLLDMSKLQDDRYWDAAVLFFSLIPENIHITVL